MEPPQTTPDGPPQPGEDAMYRNTRVRVVERQWAPTPSGGRVEQVLIQRARAGQKWVLSSEVWRVGESTKVDVAPPDHFR